MGYSKAFVLSNKIIQTCIKSQSNHRRGINSSFQLEKHANILLPQQTKTCKGDNMEKKSHFAESKSIQNVAEPLELILNNLPKW